MCEKREPPLMRTVLEPTRAIAALGPAATTTSPLPPLAPATARRASLATATASSPRLHGPASHTTPIERNGAMKSDHPGVYWENIRPSDVKTQYICNAEKHGGADVLGLHRSEEHT